MDLVFTIVLVIQIIAVFILLGAHFNLKKRRESAYYTDYRYKHHILRVYRNVDEYMAVKNIKSSRILDSGSLNMFYSWILFEG